MDTYKMMPCKTLSKLMNDASTSSPHCHIAGLWTDEAMAASINVHFITDASRVGTMQQHDVCQCHRHAAVKMR